MMKKFLNLTILSLLLASCSNEMEVLSSSPKLGESQEMTFTLEANAQTGTRSVADLSHIDQLKFAIYETESGEMIVEPTVLDKVDFSSGSFSITVLLFKDYEYTAYFWAQSSQCDAYDFFKTPKTLAIDYARSLNNDPNYDAFFAKKTFIADGKNRQKVVLTRPLARINLMTPIENWNDAIAKGQRIVQSAVTIKGIATEWNMDTNDIGCSDVTFNFADIPTNQAMNSAEDGVGAGYKLLSSCYVMALPETTKHEMTFQLINEGGGIVVKGPLTEIPIQRNNRTNLKCNLDSDKEYNLFYPHIQDALQALGNGTFEEGANANAQHAKVAVYTENNKPHIVLLDNFMTDTELIVKNDVCIELNGHTLSSTGKNVILVASGNLHLDGQMGAVKIANNQEGATISAIKVEEGATLVATNCSIEADCKRGIANTIHSYGNVTLTRCDIIGRADHTANATGKDYGTTSRAVLAEAGTLQVNDCYVYGMHSGMTVKCDLTVNGGTYDGYSHGGIYFAGKNKIARIYHAKLNDAELLEGYIDDGIAGTNKAGMYIGEATGMKVFMDHCDIYGRLYSIVLKDNATSHNNSLYISHSKINQIIRNWHNKKSINYVYFGKGNNFGPDNLQVKQNYTETPDEYNADYVTE